MIGIYKIENLINHKIYVGQSINIEERWKQHCYKAQNPNELGYNQPIHLAIRKYGQENFEYSILEECPIDQLDEKERYWISQLHANVPNGYNVSEGGQKFKVATKRICPNCGKIMSKGANLCLDCYLIDKSAHLPTSNELKEQLFMANGNFALVGRHYNVKDNTVRKWCKKYGLPYHSNDYKQIIDKKPLKIAVDQIDLNIGKIIQTFESANAAARALGKTKGNHITETCQGKHKSAYGYGWQYHKDVDIV